MSAEGVPQWEQDLLSDEFSTDEESGSNLAVSMTALGVTSLQRDVLIHDFLCVLPKGVDFSVYHSTLDEDDVIEDVVLEETAPTFNQELQAVINRHSKENGSNTPDFILADFLEACLYEFDTVTNWREATFDGRLSALQGRMSGPYGTAIAARNNHKDG